MAIVVKSNLGAGYQALKDGVSSLQECTHEQVDKLVQEFRQTMDESILPVSPLNELVINRSLEVQLQKSLFPEFVVACQQTKLADFPVSRSSTSREDLVIFHKDKFMCDASIHGAIICNPHGEDEEDEEDEEDTAAIGAAGEIKLRKIGLELGKKQLLCNMEKVAGDLAWMTVKHGKIFTKIIIYGFLVNAEGSTIAAKLIMDFVGEKSTILWCRNNLDFNECIKRLCDELLK